VWFFNFNLELALILVSVEVYTQGDWQDIGHDICLFQKGADALRDVEGDLGHLCMGATVGSHIRVGGVFSCATFFLLY